MRWVIIAVLISAIAAVGVYFLPEKPKNLSVLDPLSQHPQTTVQPSVTAAPFRLNPDTLFTYTDPQTATGAARPKDGIVMFATGDVLPARTVNASVTRMNNFRYPVEKTADFLKTADIVFINLETPLIPDCPVTVEGMIFCGDSRNIEALTAAGVDVANVANNHTGNYGSEGITQTVRLLRENNISVSGHEGPAILTVKGKKFGFLGYNDIDHKESGVAWADKERIVSDIRTLRPQVDFIIVAYHWGVEYVALPQQRQIDLGRTSIDAGADLVIGNHPHWVQGVEMYKGKLITYAHGNFIFDQMWSRETQEGVVGEYVFTDTGLTSVRYFPIIIDNYAGQPRFASPAESTRIFNQMKQSTLQIPSVFPIPSDSS